MKKIAAIAGTMLLFAATTASAEHKLLVTDIVDPGHAEVQAKWEYTHFNQDKRGNISEGAFSVGTGLAKNLELNVSLPYVFNEETQDRGEEPEDKVGWGNLTVGLKYRLLKEIPVTVTTGLDITFDTASGKADPEHNIAYSPLLAVSKNIGHETNPYAYYKPTFNSNGADTHQFAIGLEKEMTKTTTLDFRFDTTLYANGEGAENDLTIYNLDLAAYLEVCKNVYLIPSAGIARLDADGGEATALKAAAALYVLF